MYNTKFLSILTININILCQNFIPLITNVLAYPIIPFVGVTLSIQEKKLCLTHIIFNF